MTRTGCICMIAVMALAAFGILFGRVRGKDFSTPLRSARNDRRANAGAVLPTVTGEPVIFRTAEMRFVTCKSSMEVGRQQAEALGFDPRQKTEREKARQYWEKELAYRLADLLLEQGGIRFQLDGSIYRAELKAVLQERTDCTQRAASHASVRSARNDVAGGNADDTQNRESRGHGTGLRDDGADLHGAAGALCTGGPLR